MANKFPVTERTDVLPGENPIHKKHIGKDWGAETEAAHVPNTPSMSQFNRVSSINLYADYCSPDGHQLYDQYQVRKPEDADNDND